MTTTSRARVGESSVGSGSGTDIGSFWKDETASVYRGDGEMEHGNAEIAHPGSGSTVTFSGSAPRAFPFGSGPHERT